MWVTTGICFPPNSVSNTPICERYAPTKRGTWLPLGAIRPESPLRDAVSMRYENSNKLGKDMECEYLSPTFNEFCDVVICVGKCKTVLFGIKAVMSVRCRVMQKLIANAPYHDFDSRILRPKEKRDYSLNADVYHRKHNSTYREKQKVSLPKVQIDEFNYSVIVQSDPDLPEPRFNVVLQYIHTGSAYVYDTDLPGTPIYRAKPFPPSIPVNRGLTVFNFRFELPELREACLKILPNAISFSTIISMLNAMEHYIQYKSVKCMLQKLLEFVDQNIGKFPLHCGHAKTCLTFAMPWVGA
eukprot:sb/3479432/